MNRIWDRFKPRSNWPVHIGIDTPLILLSLYVSLWMRLGDARVGSHLEILNHFAGLFLAIRLFVLISYGVYLAMWRYISTDEALRVAAAVFTSVPLLLSATYLLPDFGYLPRSLFVIDAFVCTAFLMGVRILRRKLFEWETKAHGHHQNRTKMIIFGAGQNGRLLAQRILSDPNRDREILGFIDDDPAKTGRRVHGLPILGTYSELETLLTKTGTSELVVAITNTPAELMRELVVLGRKLGVRLSRIAHFEQGAKSVNRNEALYRPVDLKDLLNRPSSEVDLASVQKLLEGKIVLVTGAGGSIGAEIARQVLRFKPDRLLLLDHSELNLYSIDSELRPSTQNFDRIYPLLVDIKDKPGIESVFKRFQPQIVFHAAAYKHVHLVEANVSSAVLNNVLGTKNILDACEAHNVERFVMISTDKAVNPVGAMGASKRVCEIMTSLSGFRTNRAFSSVRFGNVLGSSGSLVPLLENQIREGGPVTLTHPDMTRYFMLIPEAVSLVLTSATLSQPGDINVLKMGEPIRIVDLARALMALMGKSEKEIGIAFTGIRPGEKMFEELYLKGDELKTRHADILTAPFGDLGANADMLNTFEINNAINVLIDLAHHDHPSLKDKLISFSNQKFEALPTLTTNQGETEIFL